MRPIFIILYASILTLVLTIFLPRLRQANPQLTRVLVVAGIAGFLLFGVLLFV